VVVVVVVLYSLITSDGPTGQMWTERGRAIVGGRGLLLVCVNQWAAGVVGGIQSRDDVWSVAVEDRLEHVTQVRGIVRLQLVCHAYNKHNQTIILTTLVYSAELLTDLSYSDSLDRLQLGVHLNIIWSIYKSEVFTETTALCHGFLSNI